MNISNSALFYAALLGSIDASAALVFIALFIISSVAAGVFAYKLKTRSRGPRGKGSDESGGGKG